MQMLVQKASVHLPRLEGGLFSSEELRLQVTRVFMSRNDASTLYESMESLTPCLAWDQIVVLTRTCKVVVVSLGADLDGANGRSKHKYASMAKEHNMSVLQEGRQEGLIVIVDSFDSATCCIAYLRRLFLLMSSSRNYTPQLSLRASRRSSRSSRMRSDL